MRGDFAAQEARMVAEMLARGIVLDTVPCEPEPTGCTGCTFHAFDLDGEVLDGGSASSLAGWIEQGMLTNVASIRPVRR